jgi:regulator of protease activity HflC (stomatin/prohibitin superfamily)
MNTRPDAASSTRLVGRLAALLGAGCAALALVLAAPVPVAREARQDGLLGLTLGSLLLAATGLLAAFLMARARAAGATGRRARRRQAIVVPLGAVAAAACAWLLRPVPHSAPPPETLYALGGAAILLAFPLLVAERFVSAAPSERLPEAPALAALMTLPTVIWPLAGCLQIAAGLGAGWTGAGSIVLALVIVLVAVELALRASANWFLPPAEPGGARAAVDSLAARLARPAAVARAGIAAPLRNHFGIDFARSWALAYMRGAALPVGFALLLFAWSLTGASLIDLDRRGVYERLGAPAGVLKPGLHVILPWPLGRIRPLEYGVVHSTPLGDVTATLPEAAAGAEDAAPASADRLWEQPHPSEAAYLIASRSNGAETFQSVSAEIRVAWRTGLTDADALRAAYAVDDPEALVRASASRLVSRFFAGRTLADAMGADREAVADELRGKLQAQLDADGSGVEVLAVVIEAVHPPAGAAEAYHGVQAAEIMARENVASERGRALATAKLASQQAKTAVDKAAGAAADATGGAEVDLRRFTADQAAARVGGQAFLLERYLGNLTLALAKAPLVIVDHRLGAPDAPVLDLRPLSAQTRSVSPDED